MATSRDERIRQLAHELWVKEGRPEGRHDEHWRLAEETADAEISGSGGGEMEGGSVQEPTAPTRRTRAPRVAKVAQDGAAVGLPGDTAPAP